MQTKRYNTTNKIFAYYSKRRRVVQIMPLLQVNCCRSIRYFIFDNKKRAMHRNVGFPCNAPLYKGTCRSLAITDSFVMNDLNTKHW